MKKALMMPILTLFLLATVGNVFGEELAKEGTESAKKFLFTTSFMPKHKYHISTSTTGKSEVNFLGNEELVKNLKAKGVKLPMKIDSDQNSIMVIETGAKKSDGTISLIMNYEKYSTINKLNGQEVQSNSKNNLEGLKLFAMINSDNTIKFERIEGNNIDNNLKIMLPKMIENILKDIKYPKEPIEIGDQFTQEIPMQIPIPGLAPVNVKIVTIYNLAKVEKKMAFFDVDLKFELIQSNSNVEMDSSGEGSGELIHDLSNNFFVENNSKFTMNLLVKTQSVNISNKAVSESKSTVEIEKLYQ